jgi:tRNA(Ile)-lysidine synthase
MSPKKWAAEFTAAEVDKLFSPLKGMRHLALAVSGGPDSVALMVLAAQWKGPVKFSVVSIDHGLREGSDKEAREVVRRAKALGLQAQALQWKDGKPKTGLQAKAREARYRLLAEWCAQNDAQGVVTAHTLDDQAETLLMRLARGSGLDGLSAMASETEIFGVRVLRPLLGISRRRLEEFLLARSEPYFEDPSNANPAFERIRIRQAAKLLGKLGLTAEALAQSAKRLQRAREALERAASDLERRAVTFQPQGHAIADLTSLMDAPGEVRLRLLQRIIDRIGGRSRAPELREIEKLDEWLKGGPGRGRTLGGCRAQKRSRSLIIGRERGRMAREPVRIKPGETLIWDDRFRIRLNSGSKEALQILPLGEARGSLVERPKDLPDFVFKSLPALLRKGKVALVPLIGYRQPRLRGVEVEVEPVSGSS